MIYLRSICTSLWSVSVGGGGGGGGGGVCVAILQICKLVV